MKIAVASDLHLEFGDLDFDNSDHAEVLLLSGDILIVDDLRDHDASNLVGESSRSQMWHEFLQRCSQRFPHVIYVLGNHEYYHGNFSSAVSKLKSRLAYLPNIYVLENEAKVIAAVTFVGTTLWTDMNNGDPVTLFQMRSRMNDFRLIWHGGHSRRFSPQDAWDAHCKAKQFIAETVDSEPSGKFVVVGHHAPSTASIAEQYRGDTVINGGYTSNLQEFILDRPQIKLWTHGHTHHAFDYQLGSTRVVCNPRGYINYEKSAEQWKLVNIDI